MSGQNGPRRRKEAEFKRDALLLEHDLPVRASEIMEKEWKVSRENRAH